MHDERVDVYFRSSQYLHCTDPDTFCSPTELCVASNMLLDSYIQTVQAAQPYLYQRQKFNAEQWLRFNLGCVACCADILCDCGNDVAIIVSHCNFRRKLSAVAQVYES